MSTASRLSRGADDVYSEVKWKVRIRVQTLKAVGQKHLVDSPTLSCAIGLLVGAMPANWPASSWCRRIVHIGLSSCRTERRKGRKANGTGFALQIAPHFASEIYSLCFEAQDRFISVDRLLPNCNLLRISSKDRQQEERKVFRIVQLFSAQAWQRCARFLRAASPRKKLCHCCS